MPPSVISLDQQLFLLLNGSDSTTLDAFFMTVTHTAPWIPLFIFVILAMLRTRSWREVLLIVLGAALVVLLADRFSSGLCKPLFHRLRPSHEPALIGLVDIVGDYRGGLYGFFSSHAANTFGVATFVSLCLSGTPPTPSAPSPFRLLRFQRNPSPSLSPFLDAITSPRLLITLLFIWAMLSSYSRIYLGLHYPADILVGALSGIIIAFLVHRLAFLPLRSRCLRLS